MTYTRIFILAILAGCNSDKAPDTVAASGTEAPTISTDSTNEKNAAVLSWLAPTAYIDQTKIEKLSAFKIYASKQRDEVSLRKVLPMTVGGETLTLRIEDLDKDTYYFGITAVDENSIEGEMSQIISKVIDGQEPTQFVECSPIWVEGKYLITCG